MLKIRISYLEGYKKKVKALMAHISPAIKGSRIKRTEPTDCKPYGKIYIDVKE